MAAQLCQKCSPQAPHFFKKFDMIYSKTEKRTPDMSASAKLVSLSAVSCASTSIISLFAIQYSYLIVDQEVIKYPSNIPQRLLYRCERKSLHLTHIHHVDQRFFWGRAPSAVWLKTTSRMTSMPRRWSSPLRQVALATSGYGYNGVRMETQT